MDHIREHGFLVRRSISPALAWPRALDRRRGERLKEHLEAILFDQGIETSFSLVHFRNADELRSAVERNGCDTVLAVLPEGSRAPRSGNDTHEQIKKLLDVPSQCVQHDHTLSFQVATQQWADIKKIDDRRVRRTRQTYELCLGNLLVKHHWFPFAPYDPFHYHVHVGLDVGGVHNTDAAACLGYGFQRAPERRRDSPPIGADIPLVRPRWRYAKSTSHPCNRRGPLYPPGKLDPAKLGDMKSRLHSAGGNVKTR